ncbi:MAG: PIN domain-containing protein [Gemmatimonadota bacterium]|nr:PIN domain-containing protein [Gemmatimonadota bacterium]
MTIGLDTSVVVRLLTGEPASAARAAARRLEAAADTGERVVVCDLVVIETYHALHHHYGVPQSEARALLQRFLVSGVVHPEPGEIVPALTATGAGLADHVIHARYRGLGAVTLTFDRRQGNLEGAVRLRG